MRQRRIIVLDEADVAGEPRLRQPLHVIEHGMNVEAFPLRRRRIGERLHPVDEFDDPVRLLADQPGQRAILVARAPSSNCAAPRMPDSGFLISWASMARAR